jgi:hypothetical protein
MAGVLSAAAVQGDSGYLDPKPVDRHQIEVVDHPLSIGGDR